MTLSFKDTSQVTSVFEAYTNDVFINSKNDSTEHQYTGKQASQKVDEMPQIEKIQDSPCSSLTTIQVSDVPLQITSIEHRSRKEAVPDDKRDGLEGDDPEAEVVRVGAVLGPRERHATLPKFFDTQGRLFRRWSYLKDRVDEAKLQHKAQTPSTKKQPVPALSSLKTTPSSGLQSRPQSITAATTPTLPTQFHPETEDGQAVCEKCLTVNGELNLTSDGGLMKAICSSCLRGDQPSPSSTQEKPQRSAKKADSKRDGHLAARARMQPIIKKPKRSTKETTETRRNLRSSRADELGDAIQDMTGSTGSQVGETTGCDFRGQAIHPPFSPQGEAQREHAPSPSPEKIQQVVNLLHAQTTRTGIAAQIARNDVQGGFPHPTRMCRNGTCPAKHCSCNITQNDQRGIMCSDSTCGKKWFPGHYLEEHCGIQLSDAHDARQTYGSWSCPECACKAKMMRRQRGVHDQAPFSKTPEFGKETLDDDELQQPLKHLTGVILQYINTAHKKPLQPSARTPFLEIPCIRDETHGEPAERPKPLLRSLRLMLDVHPGALVKERILSLQLQDQDISMWIGAVLVSLFSEFVFRAGSPFEDATVWRKGLIHVGCSVEMANMMVQDNRLRTMKERPEDFSERARIRYETQVRELHEAMKWLVGCRKEFHGFHQQIVKIAEDLNSKIWTYLGEFEQIYPKTEYVFDPKLHVSDPQEHEPQDYTGKDIMMPTMIGIKFRLPGKEWRICSRAKVRMWPKPTQNHTTPKAAYSGPAEKPHSRIIPPKRTYQDFIRC